MARARGITPAKAWVGEALRLEVRAILAREYRPIYFGEYVRHRLLDPRTGLYRRDKWKK